MIRKQRKMVKRQDLIIDDKIDLLKHIQVCLYRNGDEINGKAY